MADYYRIRGKSIFTEILGKEASKALLFIHGGPGGIGVSDFIEYQGERLAKNFKVIAPDQRGVWRSQEILAEEAISIEDIIEDLEELRKKLNIDKWSLLSHSFGGYVAVLYANLYPNSIEKLIYECPSFDFALSERSMLRNAAEELRKLGNDEAAEQYFKALEEIQDYKEINKFLMKALSELGENANNFMWYGKDKHIIERIAMNTKDGGKLWKKSTATRMKLLEDWRVYKDVFLELSNIDKPSLLMKGKYDPITCEVQTKEFMKRTKKHEVAVFDFSGHYVRIEEPDRYCEVITKFIYS
ncbi:alpha/beta hydrolase [Clostridium sp. 19966]|uniref:alpha/beta fold hydrolase n=1 Tax=Clostridium sp. 19966 TaxID=2768166 RepID=UPI0028E0367E|nr:alpha/beta hydrolase [Clostridium sp. 19966]MDT8717492.1 alpha/beta hydrolase [Clostridium sp. 19966]